MRFPSLFSISLTLKTYIIFLGFVAEAQQVSLIELDRACKKNDIKACDEVVKIQRKEAQKEASAKTSLKNRINCIKKDAEACFSEGFDQDALGNLKEANKFYEKACDLKFARGCNNRGVHAKKAKQMDIAKNFYLEACELGEMKACSALGSIEIRNDDLYEAYKYFTKACEAGTAYGCYNMGWVQAQWQNFKLANQYYQIACKKNFKEACENIEVIAERLQKELAYDVNASPKVSSPVPCEKNLKAEFLPMTKSSAYGGNVADAVNSAITKVNYEIFNRKKECGAKNIRLPASHRLPYTGVEVKD